MKASVAIEQAVAQHKAPAGPEGLHTSYVQELQGCLKEKVLLWECRALARGK